MNYVIVIAILATPVVLAIVTGSILLKKALTKPVILPEEIALAAAWVFIVGSLVWLGVFLSESTLLGFGAPWTWITAAHFAFAGFGALSITSLSCRMVSSQRSLKVLRGLLIAHPIAYLVTAAGILGFRFCDEIASASYAVIFVVQLSAVVFGRPTRISRSPMLLAVVSLSVPLVTMVPAIAWAWGRPIFDMADMVRYHGIVNAVGHVGLGFVAFAWGRPQSHSIQQGTTS
ncbi:MAG: YndJ family transporter [Rubritalea sp.]|uniref:YndJ family transporter n=1 Tax=Rubritalea sp. TaxID=2109375 RepID=UPI003241F2E3